VAATERPLLFGIYPGGVAGDDRGGRATGPPDDPAQLEAALDELQGDPERPFLVRAYLGFGDDDRPGDDPLVTVAPAGADRYVARGRRLDLVAQYQSRSGDVAGYCAYLRQLVGRYGGAAATVQVAEEPNVAGNPNLDGDYPKVAEAIVAGVAAVRDEARRLGHDQLQVGFNTTPLFGPAAGFLPDLVSLGGDSFIADLDYVGLDFFPDVFRPVAAAELAAVTAGLLRHHREEILAPAGLSSTPLHVTEHGWPTSPERPPARQADVIDTVVRTIAAQASALNITRYTLFALRDADSGKDGLFHRFGLTTDDYARKPAFDTYRNLIAELG
jgi:hypothetical protein